MSKRPVFLVGMDRTNDRSGKSTQTSHFRMAAGCVRDRQLFLSQERQSDLKCDILVKRDFITVHRCPAPMKERYGKGRSAMKEIQIHTLAETAALAQQLADLLPRPALITLSGDLGAGKDDIYQSPGKGAGGEKNDQFTDIYDPEELSDEGWDDAASHRCIPAGRHPSGTGH